MTRMRHIVAVMVVAGALGAHAQGVTPWSSAAPIHAPQLFQTVRQLADRFTCSFRTALPDVRPQQLHQEARQPVPQLLPASPAVASVHPAEITPFQFRLPPPRE